MTTEEELYSMNLQDIELHYARRRGILDAYKTLNNLVIASLARGATSKDIERYLTLVEARDAVSRMLDEK